ncbi:MAG TPA: hypothetical protein VMZ90_00545, partial [Vicinamibacterales bacterium]|nr:hypothetical protein [Vicinamibacterales bacterium]
MEDPLEDKAPKDEVTPVHPEPQAMVETPAVPELPATTPVPVWPRMAEPESDEAWDAFGMPRVQVEPPRTIETIEQRTQARKARRSALLSQVGEELFAWAKTLTSAAVYATLIVTFGFQVARVEGQSMAPTL